METQETIQLIRRELPAILRGDEEMRQWVIELTRTRYADRHETESRFDRMLEELRLDREANMRRWEENKLLMNTMTQGKFLAVRNKSSYQKRPADHL